MREEEVNAVVSLAEIHEESPHPLTIVEPVVQSDEEYDYMENIRKARSEYIVSSATIEQMAEKYNIAEKELKKHCASGKWNILKRVPDYKEFLMETIDDVYDSIDFYTRIKFELAQCIARTEYHDPKSLGMLTQCYKIADEELAKKRLTNMNKEFLGTGDS